MRLGHIFLTVQCEIWQSSGGKYEVEDESIKLVDHGGLPKSAQMVD